MIAGFFAPRAGAVLQPGGFSNPRSEGAAGLALLHEDLHASRSNITVVFASDTLAVRDAAFIAEMERTLAPLAAHPRVQSVYTWISTGNESLISPDGHTTYALVGLDASTVESQRLLPEIKALLPPPGALQRWVTGGPAAYADIELVSHRDLERAEKLSLPLAAIALLLVFGGIVSAALPILAGGASVVITLALVYALAHVTEMSIFVQNIVTMLGLGISIDYALLIVSRFREEQGRGGTAEQRNSGDESRPASGGGSSSPHPLPQSSALSPQSANVAQPPPAGRPPTQPPVPGPESSGADVVARTVATAGTAVFFSGVTVAVGLAGLTTFDYMMLRSIGIAGIIVVAVSVLAALTLLPATLALLGRRVDALPVRRGLRSRHVQESRGFWAGLSRSIARRPAPVLAAVLVLLATLGLPFLHVRLGAPDVTVLPADVESRQGFDVLRGSFGAGGVSPVLIVVEAPDGILRPEHIGALYDYTRALQQLPGVVQVQSAVTLDPTIGKGQYQLLYANPDRITDPAMRRALSLLAAGRVALVSVTSAYAPVAPEAQQLVRAMRAISPGPGMRSYIGGAAAELMDVVADLYGQFPRALLLIALTTYAALALQFRSLVLPAKAVVMDVLSILASYGALVLIFQEGHLSGLLRFTPEGVVDATVPIVMFCVLFGLSMDYEVFMLSRIKEAYDRAGNNAASVAEGLERTGRIVTSAALIIVAVSASFALADIIIIKALGVGMAIAILLDATVVRALLVPATMHLLGRWNWWAPRWLAGT